MLVDLANRRFYFFWIEIWPHEFYFVAGLLVMAGLGLFLFTAALGRVWCGYACPQTVWTDLFLLVERWVEGDRNARLRLHHAPWSARKMAAAADQVGDLAGDRASRPAAPGCSTSPTRRRWLRDLVTLQAPPVAWISIGILTATTFVFGGFMREQVCIYMCPWPRIQGAMMDEDTLTVAYRDWRGEPRGKGLKRRAEAERAEATTRAAGPQIGGRSPVIPMPGVAPRRCTSRRRRRRRAGRAGRLHRLQRLRQRLPDGHRHPRRPADGLHHLRAVHRRLRRGDGQGRPAARPDRLYRAVGRPARARGRRAGPASGGTSCGRATSSISGSGRLIGLALLFALFLRPEIEA